MHVCWKKEMLYCLNYFYNWRKNLSCLIGFLFLANSSLQAFNLTVVGIMKYGDGLGRIPIGLIDTLKEELSINCIPIEEVDLGACTGRIEAIIANEDRSAGSVAILTTSLFWSPDFLFYTYVPQSPIRIAYSMFESTRIPNAWVEVLNSSFDAVVVPDPYLIKVYQDSGVLLPIFTIPLGLYLDDWLKQKVRIKPHKPFTFGGSAAYAPHKNISLMLQAFAEEFGNDPSVIFKIHGRLGAVALYQQQIEALGISNVIFSTGNLNQQEYIEFVRSFDCYVSVSKGEGFSCCPREALALGIPSILSNNSAHKTLCKTGFVSAVTSTLQEPAYYGIPFYDAQWLGYQFNCELADVKKAMREMYENYPAHLKSAIKGRKWVSKYSWSRLKPLYLNLVKPKKLLLGKENRITDRYLMTNSPALYQKYKSLQNSVQERP